VSLVFPPEESELLFRTNLKNYLFYAKDGPTPTGRISRVAMGPVSFCNHSADANCDFALDDDATEIT
jgi:hypothetical protein